MPIVICPHCSRSNNFPDDVSPGARGGCWYCKRPMVYMGPGWVNGRREPQIVFCRDCGYEGQVDIIWAVGTGTGCLDVIVLSLIPVVGWLLAGIIGSEKVHRCRKCSGNNLVSIEVYSM